MSLRDTSTISVSASVSVSASAAAPSDEAGFAASLLAPALPCPPGLRAWNGSDPGQRLAVYRNNVTSSLIDALAAGFPVTQELVGEAFFRAMAAEFVRRQPPRSRVLACYGQRLPDFIADFEPARSVPYLADLARLEFARIQAYHAADGDALSPAAVVAALGDALSPAAVVAALGDGSEADLLRLVCHPSVAVLASRFAIASIWAVHQGQGDLAELDPLMPEAALVLRDGLDVLVLSLPPGAERFVAALLQGSTLGQAMSQALAAAAHFDLQALLTLLVRHGALCALRALHASHLPRSTPA